MKHYYWLASVFIISAIMFGFWQAQANVPQDGYANQVLEVTESGSPIKAYSGPGTGYGVYETLYWGDRVLWLGTVNSNASENWLQIFLGDGSIAWVQDNPNGLMEVNPVYTTPGARVGSSLTVLPDGDGANMRVAPTTYEERVQYVRQGQQLQIIGGPYQAEYQMWWQVRAPNNSIGWIIDVAGWYSTGIGR